MYYDIIYRHLRDDTKKRNKFPISIWPTNLKLCQTSRMTKNSENVSPICKKTCGTSLTTPY